VAAGWHYQQNEWNLRKIGTNMKVSLNDAAANELLNRGKAYHEAGHAILFHVFGMTVKNVSILPVNEVVGGVAHAEGKHPVVLQQMGVFWEGTRERDQYICHHIMINHGGEVAQSEFCPDSLEDHQASNDRRSTKTWIKQWNRFASASEREEKIQELYSETRQLLRNPLCVVGIHAVAGALLEQGQLTGDQARALIRSAMDEAKNAARAVGDPPLTITCPHCANARYDDFDDC
jgi:hypothetical protein